VKNAAHQLGSLGGGNHFIEICTDTTGGAWVMLHSGSRNIGKTLADRHISKAQGIMKERLVQLPDPDLVQNFAYCLTPISSIDRARGGPLVGQSDSFTA
jgi:RNA-splicing ligase RtcB